MGNNKIIVVGSSNTDMVVQSKHLPKPGETVLGGQFLMNPGGKGANQAVAAARLGGMVSFIAKVGDDVFGKEAIKGFEKHGIDTSYIGIDPKFPSGVALIMVDDGGENCISVALGANAQMKRSDIDRAKAAIEQSSYLLIQLEIPMKVVEHATKIAVSGGVKVVLNPAPAQKISDEVLGSIFLITPNETEAELLTGIKVEDVSTARKAASRIRSKGVAIVVITMGTQGAFVLSDELDELIPCPKVKVVDTTAAGDTFNGALVVGLSEEMSLKDAIIFANKAAAYSVTIMGAQASAPSRDDIR